MTTLSTPERCVAWENADIHEKIGYIGQYGAGRPCHRAVKPLSSNPAILSKGFSMTSAPSTPHCRLFVIITGLLVMHGAADVFAQSVKYATGIFQTNAAASITATPVPSSGESPDTAFTYQTDSKNQARFSLPFLDGASATLPTAVRNARAAQIVLHRDPHGRLGLQLSAEWGHSRIALFDLTGRLSAAGRADAMGAARFDLPQFARHCWILQVQSGTRNFTTTIAPFTGLRRMSIAAEENPAAALSRRASPATARYHLALHSTTAACRDTSGILCTLQENDNGTISLTLPAVTTTTTASEKFKQLVTAQQYESLFPNRFGVGKAGGAGDGSFDFYTYESLLKAIDALADIRVKILQRRGITYCQKVIWMRKSTGETRTMVTGTDYDTDWNATKPEDTVATFDYADFCAVGDLTTRKQELSAFCANIAHETTGGWAGAPNGGQYAWGLYWREEVAWQINPGNTSLGYVDAGNQLYPPYPNKSYHGRGPIQISYNYNYGQVSEFLYGDKSVLLQAPEKVLSAGDVAFMTAIWFWMYPQYPKPSCHDVMCGTWEPTAADIAAGRDRSRFGETINVINGGLECGQAGNTSAANRIGHYQWFADILQTTIESNCDCASMTPY
jgi:hypothetical protein